LSTIDVSDLRPTIVPKSDQLNAEQLLSGPITILVTSVDVTEGGEQPVSVHYAGEDGRPWKPCKTMRKVLVHAWGRDGRGWVGKTARLYNDTAVRFGSDTVGGIRISHLSDIERAIDVSLATTRGKKSKYHIDKLADDAMAAIKSSADDESLKAAFTKAYRSTADQYLRAAYKAAYDSQRAAIQPQQSESKA
jgi:hypothetical protein